MGTRRERFHEGGGVRARLRFAQTGDWVQWGELEKRRGRGTHMIESNHSEGV